MWSFNQNDNQKNNAAAGNQFGWNQGQQVGNSQQNDNFGWKLNSSAPPPQIQGMPMPQPGYSPNYPTPVPYPSGISDDSNAVVENHFKAKDAGVMSFAHYIVQWAGDKSSRDSTNKEKVQDYSKIRQQCLASGRLFEDPEFPAEQKSLFYSRRADRHYEWKRPFEICENPQFFIDGYSRFDIQQGELGDCWLLAAAANLTQDQNLFFRVVCEDNSFENYAGIFHFKFWQYGSWVDVVIDDRLPTYRGKLMYLHSTEQNEFWSALLEKAYAKLHGSYEALKGGTTCEALEDFTGGVTEMYELKEAPNNLFQIILKGFERGSMMACSIEPDPRVTEAETQEGLIRGHAYSITKAQMVDIQTPNTSGHIPLLRLRNPWGNEAEWNGAWSDKSSEWRYIPERVKADLGLNFDNDGEFWMSYRDFLRHFDRIEICNLSPDSLTTEERSGLKKKWNKKTFEGEWVNGISAGGCRNYLETFHQNPQYVMTLEEPDEGDEDGNCTAVVALMQKNRRSRRNMGLDCLTMGFAIYKVTERDLVHKPLKMNFFKYNASIARSPAFINLREVSCRFKLPPGHYLIVPSTFEPNEEGEFLIRVFSESKSEFEENDESIGMGEIDDRITDKNLPTPERSAIERVFLEIAGPDKEIGWNELKRILDHSMRDAMNSQEFSKDMCRSMVAMLDADHSGKLGLDEFKTLLNDIAKWKAVFKLYDHGTNKLKAYDLRDALASSGYHLNNHILNTLFYRYGSPDGTIAFDDFIMCAVKVKTMIQHFREKDFNNSNTAIFTMDEWITKSLYS